MSTHPLVDVARDALRLDRDIVKLPHERIAIADEEEPWRAGHWIPEPPRISSFVEPPLGVVEEIRDARAIPRREHDRIEGALGAVDEMDAPGAEAFDVGKNLDLTLFHELDRAHVDERDSLLFQDLRDRPQGGPHEAVGREV